MNGNILGFLIFSLNFFDGLATYVLVRVLGTSIEMNPVMRGLMEILPDSWLIPKILGGLVVWILICLRWRKVTVFAKCLICFVLSVYLVMSFIHITNFLS